VGWGQVIEGLLFWGKTSLFGEGFAERTKLSMSCRQESWKKKREKRMVNCEVQIETRGEEISVQMGGRFCSGAAIGESEKGHL